MSESQRHMCMQKNNTESVYINQVKIILGTGYMIQNNGNAKNKRFEFILAFDYILSIKFSLSMMYMNNVIL